MTVMLQGRGSVDLQTSAAAPSGGYAFVVNGIDIANDASLTPFSIGGILNVSGTSVRECGVCWTTTWEEVLTLGITLASGTVSAPDSFGRVSFNLTSSNDSSGNPRIPQFILTGYIVGSESDSVD